MADHTRGTIVSLENVSKPGWKGYVVLDTDEGAWRAFGVDNLAPETRPGDLGLGMRVYCWSTDQQLGVSVTPLNL